MQSESSPRRLPSTGTPINPDAEVLDWLGTAFGRTDGSQLRLAPPANFNASRAYILKAQVQSRSLGIVLACALTAAAVAAYRVRPDVTAKPAELSAAPAASLETQLPPAANSVSAPRSDSEIAPTKELKLPLQHAARPVEAETTVLPAIAPNEIAAVTADRSAPLDVLQPVAVNTAEVTLLPAASDNAPANPVQNFTAGNADILAGRRHFANGDIAAARRFFEKAAKAGVPEGALALGTTYDPASLRKANIKVAGDTSLARYWYRRAYSLALSHKEAREE